MHRLLTGIGFFFFFGVELCYATNVKDFGARGDGITDDTQAISLAVSSAKDGYLEFPKGVYKITRTIWINLIEDGPLGITGTGGSARILMSGEGPAFLFTGSHQGTADPSTVTQITGDRERMPLISSLEIKGEHVNADGIEIRNVLMPVLKSVLIRDVRNGVHFTSRNRNIIISDCHIYDARGIGIFLDKVNIHQMIISNSHISYCRLGGINIIGSEIRNLQITGNDIEYNCSENGSHAADIFVDCSQSGSVREGTISGNTIQAVPSPSGANIRFAGLATNPDKIGLFSITGNHISNQQVNIQLEHCRGISIAGNTFIRGYERHIVFDDCKNIVLTGNVFDHNEDYFPKGLKASGGITLNNSKGLMVSDNVLDGSGTEESESDYASVKIKDCEEVILRGMIIGNNTRRGIHIDNSRSVRMTDCIIGQRRDRKPESIAVMLTGNCDASIVKDNTIYANKKEAIVNTANGVVVKENTLLDY